MQDTALYLEADEDITSAIDKLSKSPATLVQVVVPKRSTMLQSIINLKLLKKAAATHKKELVLVTGDKIATELASRVGLAVAPSLGAKAIMSEAQMPAQLKSNEEVIEESDPEPVTPALAAAEAVPPTTPSKKPLFKRRDIDAKAETPPPDAALTSEAKSDADKPTPPPPPKESKSYKPDHGKGPKVPNFGRLQRGMLWAGLAVILIGGYFLFMALFTHATVTLFTNGTKVSVDTSFAVDTSATSSNPSGGVLAGQTISYSKTLNGPFAPTGQQNVGTQATGTMTIYNSYDENSHTLVSGTRFQAPDGNIFTSTSDVTVPGASLGLNGGHVSLNPGTVQVSVQASQNGSNYNESPTTYTIPGLPENEQSTQNGIYGQGSQMSGGTTKTVTVVAQSDVDTAKAALLSGDASNISADLKSKLPSGYVELAGSESTTTSNIAPAPAVGQQASTANLSLKATYTALAVKSSDYSSLLNAQEQKQIGAGNQIYSNGMSGAQVTTAGKDDSGRPLFHLSASAYTGPKLDATTVANKVKGQRFGDAADTASGFPGVDHASISIWPAWASHLPSSASKIKVVIQVAGQ